MVTPTRQPARPVVAGGVAVAATTAGAYAVFHRLGATSGSTAQERARPLPGDDLIGRPTLVTNHAATLGAPPEDVWPWLTQVDWHFRGLDERVSA